MSDPISDMLTRIRNAVSARHARVDMPASRLKAEIARILQDEGYIHGFKLVEEPIEKGGTPRHLIRIFLKYDDATTPVIHGIQKVSTPGRRVYSGYKGMPRVINGYGTLIVSTSIGVTTGKKAVEKKVGGEIICTVW